MPGCQINESYVAHAGNITRDKTWDNTRSNMGQYEIKQTLQSQASTLIAERNSGRRGTIMIENIDRRRYRNY